MARLSRKRQARVIRRGGKKYYILGREPGGYTVLGHVNKNGKAMQIGMVKTKSLRLKRR